MSEKITEQYNYLTDEELLDLIEDTEKNMTMAAPPDIAESVLEKIEIREAVRETNIKSRVAEYRLFCVKVGLAVAAAIAIIIVAPFISPRLRSETGKLSVYINADTGTDQTSRAEMLRNTDIPSKSDIVKDDIPTREETLSRRGITDNIRDSHRISDAYNRNSDR